MYGIFLNTPNYNLGIQIKLFRLEAHEGINKSKLEGNNCILLFVHIFIFFINGT